MFFKQVFENWQQWRLDHLFLKHHMPVLNIMNNYSSVTPQDEFKMMQTLIST